MGEKQDQAPEELLELLEMEPWTAFPPASNTRIRMNPGQPPYHELGSTTEQE